MQILTRDLDKASNYRLMISALIPRPIAWVGTRGLDGRDNLAPFSYFMGVSSDPPLIAISVARNRGGGLKDTARNILDTREFSVSLVEEPQLNAMHQTSAAYLDSEFDQVGVGRVSGQEILAPRVQGARVACECRLFQAHDLGSTHLILGEILAWFVEEDLFQDGRVDLAQYRPVARLGGNDYTTLGSVITKPPARV